MARDARPAEPLREQPPPAERLGPDDHYMVVSEDPGNPLNIGALILLDVPPEQADGAAGRLRAHLARRLALTPLMRVLHRAPLSFDSDVWVRPDAVDLDDHIRLHSPPSPLTDRELCAYVAERAREPVALERPPFRIDIVDRVAGDRAALYVVVPHAVTDGIGFQTILGLLSDDDPDPAAVVPAAPTISQLPRRHDWLATSLGEFRRLRATQPDRDRQLADAREALRDPALKRASTPQVSISGPTSDARAYTTITLAFAVMRSVGRALDATVNDVYLAVIGTAMRDYLLERDDLPATPLVANSARSYRRPEHGAYGNRISAIRPGLGTHLADPEQRLRSIQQSMALERRRAPYEEALLGQPETPFGPYRRRRRQARRVAGEQLILPGNVSVSNVPGPAGTRSYAGLTQFANYPTPILGNGRCVNFTGRRNGGSFDIGLMVDPARVPDPEHLAELVPAAMELYRRLAAAPEG